MIPFEADPIMYGVCALFLIAFVALIIILARFTPEMATLYSIFSTVVIIAFVLLGVGLYTGSTERVDIVVCNHITESSFMYLVGENQQMYMVSDSALKLKIKDGETIHATILNEWVYAYPKIYKIDTPFVCGAGC